MNADTQTATSVNVLKDTLFSLNSAGKSRNSQSIFNFRPTSSKKSQSGVQETTQRTIQLQTRIRNPGGDSKFGKNGLQTGFQISIWTNKCQITCSFDLRLFDDSRNQGPNVLWPICNMNTGIGQLDVGGRPPFWIRSSEWFNCLRKCPGGDHTIDAQTQLIQCLKKGRTQRG